MGIEAITKARLRVFIEDSGLTESEVAANWGYKPNGGYMKEEPFLIAEARMRLVCQGDALHHKIARQVSDNFEHGLANGGELFEPARDCLIPIANYLRQAIFVVARIENEDIMTLNTEPYSRPRGLGGLEQYFRTTIVGDLDKLAAVGCAHPQWEWHHSLKSVTFNVETSSYSFSPDTKLTARVGTGTTMNGGRLEVWDAGYFIPESAADKSRAQAVPV